jgi:hypothetical protein
MLGPQEVFDRKTVTTVTTCQICGGSRLRKILELGNNPAVVFLTEQELGGKKDERYPLGIQYCETCGCVQSRYIVDPNILFGEEYHHISGIPVSFRRHLQDLAALLVKRFSLTAEDLIVEIGSSDGALLEQVSPYRVKVLGIDPSSVAKIAIEKGIPTIREFFGEVTAQAALRKFGRAKIVIALNTFAHVAALDSLMKGVNLLLDEGGVFVTESHYLMDLVSKLQYDFIYHEHLRYYSLRTLVYLFNKYGMEVFDVERIPTHSGSIRVFACRKGTHRISASVGSLLEAEYKSGLSSFATYEEFAQRTEKHKVALTGMLTTLKQEGNRIVGLTYPARALTLLQYCGIGQQFLDYITEKSPLKVGKYAPGTHIKIVDESLLFKEQPGYGLLLSWHLADEIIPKFKANGYKGKFIIPLPEPRIVD